MGKAWDEGVPLLVFAAQDTVQESLGFSPAALMFGHSMRSPPKVFKDKLLSVDTSQQVNVLDFITNFREQLHQARTYAQQGPQSSQGKMKKQFDRSTVARHFKVGDDGIFLPLLGFLLWPI